MRLSKEEAMDVASTDSTPGNLFVYMTAYKERGEERVGYIIYRDYGNDEHAQSMDRLNITTESGWKINQLASKTKGDIVEMVLGLGFICTKKQWKDLTDIPEIVNAIELALQKERPTAEHIEAKDAESKIIHDEKVLANKKEYEMNLKKNII
eukprot:7968907-Heterocapsa_arctica.AAC.1